MEQKIPAVSVVIPMYNAEKYIAACLESLLAQTFKDFEVIVVDDCSTDKSCAIVEGYVKKFTGGGQQFKLLKSKKNSGMPANPRNKGLNFSYGKYVYFMDADDLIVANALQELFLYAENYNVDFVCMHKYISFEDDTDKLQMKNPKIINNLGSRPDIPVSVSENIAERIPILFQGAIHVMPWLQFSRRDFLIENEIYFPEVLLGEDVLWIMHVVCEAKKILLIPDALYAYRTNPDSITRSPKTVEQKIKHNMSSLVNMKFMKVLLKKEKFFQENPQYWYAWVNHIIAFSFNITFQECALLPPYEVYKIFYEQFAQELGEHAELISYLCSMINIQQKQLYLANAKISELEKRLSQS